ncbi:MAG TPA: PAS domain-containing protein [Candidatus Saccharimonadales bacterium]|jgi:PAS domain S-box-containing protein|nr:PAS domain-containing protein [Candidatus Saccharimonadales bacterium]
MILNMASAGQQPEPLNIQLLVDSIPALIHTAMPDGSLDYFNKPWLDYLGATLDDVAGWKWTAVVHPEDVDGIVAQWRACLATGEIFEYETRVRRADGKYRWMFHRKVPLRDASGYIVKWYGSSLDIDERKTASEQLRRNAEDLQRSEFYLAEGQRLAHMGSWAFDLDGFYYWSPELFRMHGLDPASKPPSIQEYLDLVHSHDRESMADVIKGVLAKATTFDATKRIVRPNGEVRYIRCVGAPAIENRSPKKYVGSALDVTEHELLTQELRRREAYMTEAQRLSHTGSFGWRPDTGEIVWSDETYRIFEFDPAERPTISVLLQCTHPQDRALVQQVIERASQTGTDFEHEYRLLLSSGSIKHVRALAKAFHDASGNIEFIGAVTDITERKSAEKALRSSEAYLAEAQRLSHTGSWAWSPDTDVRYWSEECYRVLGFDPRDGVPRTEELIQRIHPDDQPSFRESANRTKHNKFDEVVDYRIVHPSGDVKDIHSIGHPVFSAGGDLLEYTGTVIDVTERKRAVEELRSSEMELRQMLDLSPQQVAVFGPRGERLYANRVALDYLGNNLEEWRQTTGTFFSSPGLFIHPDDRERVARAYSDNTRSSGSAYELELRLRGADGNFRWFLSRFNPLRDEHGQITRWYVTGTDIDDRKQAEDRLRRENVALREEIDKASMFEEIVGTSPALQTVLSLISKVARSNSTVLITGETGTGKELVARAIHRRSNRSGRAFISVNCAAIPRELIASELFGHEKGAFTGATQQRLGRFELANGGTLFLDEVGELPAETQIALLRVLQEHEFERVGGTRPIRADVRVIAATNRDLQTAISAGSFRSDLFYRLNVFPIEIPPLRERKEDIRLLLEYFIDRYARNAGKNITTVDKKTLRLLESYPWPGNIRELQNVIERSVIVCETPNFSVDESWLSRQPPERKTETHLYLSEKVASQEKEMIEAALRECQGRVYGPSGAATKLGIARSTLESKIKSLKINKNRFRA